MQAIRTKYIPATNKTASRIKAACRRFCTVTVFYDHALSIEGNHKAACAELKKVMAKREGEHWLAPMVTGCLPDGSYAHVFAQ